MAAEDIPEADHSEGAPAADSAEAEVLAPVVPVSVVLIRVDLGLAVLAQAVRDLAALAEGGADR